MVTPEGRSVEIFNAPLEAIAPPGPWAVTTVSEPLMVIVELSPRAAIPL